MPHAARTPPPPTAAALPREAVPTPPAVDDALAWGCGWYASSFELRCGVEVYEEVCWLEPDRHDLTVLTVELHHCLGHERAAAGATVVTPGV